MAKINVDLEKCNGCGTCVSICPVGAYEFKEDRLRVVNEEGCLVCKACETYCPRGALLVLE